MLTQHEDKKIRLWDMEDGRCFSITSEDIFPPGHQLIHKFLPLFKSRSRFFLTIPKISDEGGKSVFILDI